MSRIVMLSAPAGTGKTTTVQCMRDLCHAYGFKNFAHISLASELKSLAFFKLGWDGTKSDNPDNGRAKLVQLGMEMRNKDEDYWVRIVAERCAYTLKLPHTLICIDDLRFSNELHYMKRLYPSLVIHTHLTRSLDNVISNEAEEQQTILQRLAHYTVQVVNENPYSTAHKVLNNISVPSI